MEYTRVIACLPREKRTGGGGQRERNPPSEDRTAFIIGAASAADTRPLIRMQHERISILVSSRKTARRDLGGNYPRDASARPPPAVIFRPRAIAREIADLHDD